MRKKLLLIALLLPALPFAQNLNSPNIAVGFLDQAESFMIEEDYETATVFYKKAASIFAEEEMWKPYYSCLASLAESCLLSDNYPDAKKYAKEALWEGYKKMGTYDENSASAAHLLAEVYVKTNQVEKAEMVHKTGLGIHRSLYGDDHPSVANSYQELGGFYFAQSQIDAAEECYKIARDIRIKNFGETHLDVAKSLVALAELQSLNQNFEMAFNNYQQALTIRQSLLGSNHKSVVQCLLKSIDVLELEAEKTADSRLAQSYKNYQKGDLLLSNQLSGIDNIDFIEETAQERIIDFYNKAIETAYQLYLASNDKLYWEQALLFSEKCKWISKIASLFPNCATDFSAGFQFYEPKELTFFKKEYLSSKKGIVEYFIGDSSCFIFTLSNTGLWMDKVEVNELFHEHLEALRMALKSNPSQLNQEKELENRDILITSLLQLNKKVFVPALKHFSTELEEVIIIPDQALWAIPFGLLLPEDAQLNHPTYQDLPYLLHQYRFYYSPSINDLTPKIQIKKNRQTIDDPSSSEPSDAVPVALQSMKRDKQTASPDKQPDDIKCPEKLIALWEVPTKETMVLEGLVSNFEKKYNSKAKAVQQAKLAFLTGSEIPSDRLHPHYWAGIVPMATPLSLEASSNAKWKWFFALGILCLLGFQFFFKKR